jgi:hypothetical protein
MHGSHSSRNVDLITRVNLDINSFYFPASSHCFASEIGLIFRLVFFVRTGKTAPPALHPLHYPACHSMTLKTFSDMLNTLSRCGQLAVISALCSGFRYRLVFFVSMANTLRTELPNNRGSIPEINFLYSAEFLELKTYK